MASNYQFSQIDYSFKKNVANKVKTDSNGVPIFVENEAIYTSQLIASENLWLQSDLLKQGPTGSQSVITQQINVPMTSIHGIGSTQDYPNLLGYSWYCGIQNWIEPSYNLSFSPRFYVGPFNSTPGNSDVYSIASSNDYPFVFDYKTGILTFLNTLPVIPYNLSSLTTGGTPYYQTTYRLWITGYTYTGLTLSSTGPNSILTNGGGYSGSGGPTGATGPAGSSSSTGATGYTGPTGHSAPVYYAEFNANLSIPTEGSNYYGFTIAQGLAYTINENIIIQNLSDKSLHFEAIVFAYDKNTGIISFGSVTNVTGDFSTSDNNYSINLTGARGTKWFASNSITDVTYIGRSGDLYLNFETGEVYMRS
jgi:hypothetical protein